MPFTANAPSRRIAPGGERQGHTPHQRRSPGARWLAGPWCCNAGHARDDRPRHQAQAEELDYAPPSVRPRQDLRLPPVSQPWHRYPPRVFAGSGSRPSIPRSRSPSPTGTPRQGAKMRLIGRERGYHGVLRRHLGRRHRSQPQVLRLAAHRRRPLPHTYDRMAGLHQGPAYGAHFADELSASSPCTMLPPSPPHRRADGLPPRRPAPGLFEAPARAVHARHPVDSTGDFGFRAARFRHGGAPRRRAPDMICFAKGVTSHRAGGGVIVRKPSTTPS